MHSRHIILDCSNVEHLQLHSSILDIRILRIEKIFSLSGYCINFESEKYSNSKAIVLKFDIHLKS